MSKWLSGCNITLLTIAKICLVLGMEPKLTLRLVLIDKRKKEMEPA